ncbi:MAG: nuclear transport factor 2 family protein [Planctomycetaceae bacterium]
MSYLTDNPWPLIIVLTGAAVISLFIAPGRGKPIALMCLAGAVLVWFVEGAITSPAELIEAQAGGILEGFKSRDLDAISARISDDSPELVETARQGLELVDLQSDFEIRNVEVTSLDDTSATVKIRANGTGKLRGGGYSQRVPTYWSTDWKKQNGEWQLSGVRRLDVVTGKEMGTFDRN